MKVNVKIDHGKINALSAASKKAIALTAEQLRTEVIQANVIPFDEGTLQNVQTHVDTKALSKGEVQIYHDTPYAARLYHHPEYNFDQKTNRNARGNWWEDWITGSKRNHAKDLFKAIYKKLTGVD